MNPNQFQSVIGRNSKLAVEDPRLSHHSSGTTAEDGNLGHHLSSTPFRQSLAPVPSYHHPSVPPPSSTIPRGVRTPNWRGSASSLENVTSPSQARSWAELPATSRDTHFTDVPVASRSHLPYPPVSSFDPSSNASLLSHNTYISVAGFGSSKPSSAFQSSDNHLFEHPRPSRKNAKMHPQNGNRRIEASWISTFAVCGPSWPVPSAPSRP
jgi:hypothetical protein